jgi:hypothetical protein
MLSVRFLKVTVWLPGSFLVYNQKHKGAERHAGKTMHLVFPRAAVDHPMSYASNTSLVHN